MIIGSTIILFSWFHAILFKKIKQQQFKYHASKTTYEKGKPIRLYAREVS